MSMKILKTLENVLEEKKVRKELLEFLQIVVNFECFENTHRYKVKYREALDICVKTKERNG